MNSSFSFKHAAYTHEEQLIDWAIKARYLAYPVVTLLVLLFLKPYTAPYEYFLLAVIIAFAINITGDLLFRISKLRRVMGVVLAIVDILITSFTIFLTGGFQSPFFILLLLHIFGVSLLGNAVLTLIFALLDIFFYIMASFLNASLHKGVFVFVNSLVTNNIINLRSGNLDLAITNISIFVLIVLILIFVNLKLNSALKELFSERKEIGFLLDTMDRFKKLEPINDFLSEMTNMISETLGYRYNAIILLNKEKTALQIMEYSPKADVEDINNILGFELDKLWVPMHSENNMVVKAMKERSTMITHNEWDLLVDAVPQVTEEIAKTIQQTTGTKVFALVPIIAFGEAIGILEVESKAENLNEGNVRLLESFASQLGTGIVNSRLYTETLKQKEEIEKHYQEMNTVLGELQLAYSRLEDFTKELELSKHKLEEMKGILYHTDKLANIGQVIASITHQFSTPVSVIAGQTELLNKELENKGVDIGRERLEKIKLSINKLDESVKRLMSSVRLTRAEFTSVNVNSIINSIASLWEYELRTKGIELIKELDEKLPDIQAIPEAIEQLLVNLISNARDAMENRKGNIVISTRFFDKDNIEIEVKDEGIGIPDEQLAKIFTPFFTTKPAGKGTGLGMTIVMNAIEEHNGRLLVKSELNKGTIFTIILPIEHRDDRTHTA
ncbi:MAG: ATP-binding protein [bacterium]